MSDLRGYDSWKLAEGPAGEDQECPECGEPALVHGTDEVDCQECGWHDEKDWDAIAEARAEAREFDDHGRETW